MQNAEFKTPNLAQRKNRGDSLFSLLENRELYRLFRPTGQDLIIGAVLPFLIIFVTLLAVIVILYYLTREEPRETERFAQFPNLFRQNEELRCVLANIVPLSLFDACGKIKNPVI